MTRMDRNGYPEGGWYPEECLTIEEAVRGFTTNAAFASFMEHIKGTIQPSMLADVTILDADPFVIPAREILSTRVVYTVVGGRIVYEAPGKASAEE